MDPLPENAIYNERPVRVICVGAGPSGLCLAYKLKRSFANYSLTLYEKNPEIGGTWYENRYPGCSCDVPSHNYTFSFEPKPDWSSVYASSAEIRSYFEGFATKYELQPFIRTSHRVIKTEWDEAEGKWSVEVQDLTVRDGEPRVVRDWCHILVHATGYLNNPHWPDVAGLDRFKGVKVHTGDYDAALSLEGKDVILIGGAASAVQTLPVIQPVARSVKNFIRSPAWMLPTISTVGAYSAEDVRDFIENPGKHMELRKENERIMNSIFPMYMKGTVLQEQAKELLISMTTKVLGGDEYLVEKLIPKFSVGCKRVAPGGNRYIETLQKPNVQPVFSAVVEFTEDGCIDEAGTHHRADVIICATGFDTSFIPRYPILLPESSSSASSADGSSSNSRAARNLQDERSAGPDSIQGYMGVAVPEYPNMFTLLGPWTPASNGPILVALEAQADYICGFVDRYQTEHSVHSFFPSAEAGADFKAQAAVIMRRLVWTDDCRNSHNNHSAGSRVPTTWPGSTLHYLEALREPRLEDWRFRYRGNRFAWMGEGVSRAEWEPTADLAYYLRDSDEGDVHGSRGARARAIAKVGSRPARALHREPKLAPTAAAPEAAQDKQS